MSSVNFTTAAAKGINVQEFKTRYETEALARTLFYDDVDANLLGHLKKWELSPLATRDHYRSLARRINRRIQPPPPSFMDKVRAAGQRFMAMVAP